MLAADEVPDWKRKLITMKKRTGTAPTPTKTVTRTIGTLNVALRSVAPEGTSPSTDEDEPEELQYGPGIVDRLRARFLNLCVGEKRRRPPVRRFSSLENLPEPRGPASSRGARAPFRPAPTVKKAQSMETLLGRPPEPVLPRRPANENDDPGVRRRRCSINEDELPKPDTVRQVKRLFESPPTSSSIASPAPRFRSSSANNKQPASPSAKEDAPPLPRLPARDFLSPDEAKISNSVEPLSEEEEEEEDDTPPSPPPRKFRAPEATEELDRSAEEQRRSQGDQVDGAEPPETPPQQESPSSPPTEMLAVAANGGRDAIVPPWHHRKAPAAATTTTVVFDFRGKDVKPNVSLHPAPFGCRPAPHKRRSGSPPRVNGECPSPGEEDDDEDWDETDIGADLPAVSGIVFAGENVKVGRGALLEKRNKKLTIQFDDQATSTFEYPSENSSPSPSPQEENGHPPLKTAIAIGSPANSRFGLSTYTPHVLSSNDDFELGISRPNNRHSVSSPNSGTEDEEDEDPNSEEIVPASPESAGGWSTAGSSDILF